MMKTKKVLVTLAFGSLAISSCSQSTRTETLVPVPYDDGTASFGAKGGMGGMGGTARGKWLSRGTANVLDPEQVEAYTVARYEDPSNPNVMHERHFVYRKQAQKWNLTPNTNEQINLGNLPERSRIIDGRIAENVSRVAVEDALITHRDALRNQGLSRAETRSNASNIEQLEFNQRKLAEALSTVDARSKKAIQEQQRAIAEAKKAAEAAAKNGRVRETGDKDFYNTTPEKSE